MAWLESQDRGSGGTWSIDYGAEGMACALWGWHGVHVGGRGPCDPRAWLHLSSLGSLLQ